MPRACSVCAHPKRQEVDAAISAATPYRDIARQYGLSKDAVARHASEHIAQAVAASQAARSEASALDVVAQLKAINGATLAILQEARRQSDPDLALKAIDRIQRQIELQAKLLGDLDERPQVNVLVAPEWVTARTTLMRALEPFTEARIAVAGALTLLEGGKHDQHDQRGA